MRGLTKSVKSFLILVFGLESIILYAALLRFAFKLSDRGDYWSRWNIETEDALFILIAAVALRLNKLWSYVVAALGCALVLLMVYKRWAGNWEFVFATYQHHLTQIILAVAILTYAVACVAHRKGGRRILP